MKIGSRIALFYTIITVGAIAAVVMVFYFFTSRYINHLYDSYLIEKAYLTAQKHWEKMRWMNTATAKSNRNMTNCCHRRKRYC